MKCFKCNITLSNCKSEYGFYYFCPRCKKTFETSSQKTYNKKYNNPHPNIFTKKNNYSIMILRKKCFDFLCQNI